MKNDWPIVISTQGFYRFLLILHVTAIGDLIHAQENSGDRNEVAADHSLTRRQWMIPEDRLCIVGQATSTLAWHPEGKLAAFGQTSNPGGNQMVQELMLVDIETDERMKVATLPADTALQALVWDSSGRILILSGGSNGNLASFAWDVVLAKPIWNIPEEQVIGTGADGQIITVSTLNRDVKIRRGATGEELAIVKEAGVRFYQRKVCIASDGAHLQCFDYETNSICSWSLQDGSALPDVKIAGHRDARPPATATFSSSGNMLITGGWDHTVRVWNTHSGTEECVFTGHATPVISVACSSSGEIITSRSRDSMRSWTRSARKQIAALEDEDSLENVSTDQLDDTMSPAGNYVATFGKGVFRLFDIQTMQEPCAKGENKSESSTPPNVAIPGYDLKAGIGVYYVDGTKLIFSDGRARQVLADAHRLEIMGCGKSGLVFCAGEPVRIFCVAHKSREISEISAKFAINGEQQKISKVIPDSSGNLVMLTFPHGCLYWTDGSKDEIRKVGEGLQRFDYNSVELVGGKIFIGEIASTNSEKRFKFYVLNSAGQLKAYYEETMHPAVNHVDNYALPDYVSSKKLFKAVDSGLAVSPSLQSIYDNEKSKNWKWEKTASTIYLHSDLSRGLEPGVVVGDTLYFAGYGFREGSKEKGLDSIGLELYRTDGTLKGTRLAHDFDKRQTLTEGASSMPRQLTPLGESGLVLLANDTGSDNSAPWGPSIWSFSGSNATRLVSGVEPISFHHQPSENYRLRGRGQRQFLAVGGRVYYFLQSPVGVEVWQTDGTVDGTVRLVETQGRIRDVFPMGTSFLFSIDEGSGCKLWVCDGTTKGTAPVGGDVIPSAADFFPIPMAN